MSFESVAFEASLQKVNQILRLSGTQIDDNETSQTFMERLWNRKFYCFFNITLYMQWLGEMAWAVKSIQDGKFIQVTNCAPCLTLCLLGSAKCYYRIKYGHHINDFIDSLRRLHSLKSPQFESGKQKNLTVHADIGKMVRKLNLAIKIFTIMNTVGLIAFLLGPLIIIAFVYHATGEVELRLPFLILYPFNAYDLRVYPFIYVYEMIGGTFAVFTVVGPDCLYHTFCTYLRIQFRLLYHDIETIIKPNASLRLQNINDEYCIKIKACVTRHKELIRCADLIEITYAKSSLFNFMSSTLLLCMAGFNIMAYEDLVMFSNFFSFLFMCLLQIYLICDYSDSLSRASTDLSFAVYNSQWYKVDAKMAKKLFMILTRAQKPCKLTAYTFTDINLGAFTRILSSSWSYFALLQSVYARGNEH